MRTRSGSKYDGEYLNSNLINLELFTSNILTCDFYDLNVPGKSIQWENIYFYPESESIVLNTPTARNNAKKYSCSIYQNGDKIIIYAHETKLTVKTVQIITIQNGEIISIEGRKKMSDYIKNILNKYINLNSPIQ